MKTILVLTAILAMSCTKTQVLAPDKLTANGLKMTLTSKTFHIGDDQFVFLEDGTGRTFNTVEQKVCLTNWWIEETQGAMILHWVDLQINPVAYIVIDYTLDSFTLMEVNGKKTTYQ
jgi:hypothetical protein